uniref:Uncharacterized protein n=1 Tax=Romanomermis culicivorax TaxID=13658 RepID=A0A915KR55_ROMCU
MKKISKLIYHEFTKSGLLKALKDGGGKLLWAADEFGELLVHALNPNDKEWKGFRGILNNFYSGRGISKAFAGRDTCILDHVIFSIAGTTQPQPFCAIMEKLMNTNDGLIDRFMQISAPGNSRPNYGPMSKQVAEISNDWPKKLLLYAYNQHANIEPKNYELSEDALECLQSYRSAEQEHREMIYDEAEEALCSPTTTLKDFNFNFGDSKDIDNALRCALLLHVAKYSFEYVLSNNVIDIPNEIPLKTLQGAFELITVLKKQFKVYTTMLSQEDIPSSSKLDAIASASRKVTNEQVDIRKLIMNFPGPVVTSSFLCRINRKLTAQEIITHFKHLGTYKVGDLNYMGIYKEVGVLHNRCSQCFFKAPRNEIKPELFDELDFDGYTYEQFLNRDISDEPPAKLAKLSQSWEAFYRELIDQYKTCFNIVDE